MRELRRRTPLLLSIVLAALLAGCTSGDGGSEGGQAAADVVPDDRSALPCRAPLAWRVGEIDPRWNLDRDEVLEATLRAARVWEEAAARPLFPHDPEEGLPIRLAYDERQVGVQVRRGGLDSARAALEDSLRALEATGRRLEGRAAALNDRIRSHNRRVERLRRDDGISNDLQREIRREERSIRREQERLSADREAFDRRRRRLQRQQDRLEAAVDEYNRTSGERGPMKAGRYSEEVTIRDGEVASVEKRAIEVRSFDDATTLSIVIAHELGHALGLGHVEDPAALMAEAREIGAGRHELALTAADRRELRRRCPGLLEAP